MSGGDAPRRPLGPRLSHLYSEPLSMSFASPQQLAQLTSMPGSIFDNIRALSQPQQPINPGYGSNHNNHQYRPRQPVPNVDSATPVAAASASASNKKIWKPLTPQPINLSTFKGFKFLTLDGLQIETRDIYDKISGTYKWEMCENQSERCLKFIRDECADRRVFLVASGSLGSQVVPQIHGLPQVYAIYIYCANVKFHREWANKYNKVRTVCDNDDRDLLPLFAVDVAQSNIDWANALLHQGDRNKAKEKLELASNKLKTYAKNYDPAMDEEIKQKLDECK